MKVVFPKDVMEAIGTDHHKNRDGCLEFSYDYWNDIWWIHHPGYVRDEISTSGKTLEEAIVIFVEKITKQNKRILEFTREEL